MAAGSAWSSEGRVGCDQVVLVQPATAPAPCRRAPCRHGAGPASPQRGDPGRHIRIVAPYRMCTIVLLRGVVPGVPLLIAANRDEFHDRTATVPAVVDEARGIIAGTDLRGGGTWMGATRAGFFVGLTNQRTFAANDPTRRSRGEVAMQALSTGTLDGTRRLLEGLDPDDYNPFNLVYGDAGRVEVAYVRGIVAGGARKLGADRDEAVKGPSRIGLTDAQQPPPLAFEEVPPGVHVVPNDRLNAKSFPKCERSLRLVRGVLSGGAVEEFPSNQAELHARSPKHPSAAEALGILDEVHLRTILGNHELPTLEEVPEPPPASILSRTAVRLLDALCIHTPSYGTRSSTVIALDGDGLMAYRHADGPPCTTSFRDVL